MTDNKLTDVPDNNVGKLNDSEIVNDVEQVTMALEYCVECDCEKYPYDELTACNEYLKLDAVKVINRLQAENEKKDRAFENLIEVARLWKEKYSNAKKELFDKTEQLKTAKAEAYKEFAEKIEERIAVKILKDKSNEYAEGFVDALDGVNGEIDNLLKELVGE